MKPGKSAENFFQKKFRKSRFGYPIGTISYYDPDDLTATRVAVGIADSPFIY